MGKLHGKFIELESENQNQRKGDRKKLNKLYCCFFFVFTVVYRLRKKNLTAIGLQLKAIYLFVRK